MYDRQWSDDEAWSPPTSFASGEYTVKASLTSAMVTRPRFTVTASEMNGAYAMQTIMVTVMTPNIAPMSGDNVEDLDGLCRRHGRCWTKKLL